MLAVIRLNSAAHHIKHEFYVLRNHGLELVNAAHDTMLESYIIDSTAMRKATAVEVFGVPLEAVEPDQRRSATAINSGLTHGMSVFGLTKQLHIGHGEAQT